MTERERSQFFISRGVVPVAPSRPASSWQAALLIFLLVALFRGCETAGRADLPLRGGACSSDNP